VTGSLIFLYGLIQWYKQNALIYKLYDSTCFAFPPTTPLIITVQ
jgi:hypothetical protein